MENFLCHKHTFLDVETLVIIRTPFTAASQTMVLILNIPIENFLTEPIPIIWSLLTATSHESKNRSAKYK